MKTYIRLIDKQGTEIKKGEYKKKIVSVEAENKQDACVIMNMVHGSVPKSDVYESNFYVSYYDATHYISSSIFGADFSEYCLDMNHALTMMHHRIAKITSAGNKFNISISETGEECEVFADGELVATFTIKQIGV